MGMLDKISPFVSPPAGRGDRAARNDPAAFIRVFRNAVCFLLAALTLVFSLTGCVLTAAVGGAEGVYVYRLHPDGGGQDNPALTAEAVAPGDGESRLDAALRGLNSQPADLSLRSVFPEGVTLLTCRVEGGRAACEMSDGYAALQGVEKLLADYALVYTLSRLDEVLCVDILCGGKTLSSGLTTDNALLADAGYGGCERILKLLIPDADEQRLAARTAVVTDTGEQGVEELCAGALLEELTVLPEGTRLLSVSNEDGLCVVDLSEEIYATEPRNAANARLLIASFVETLVRLPGVDQVRIEVNGAPMTSYGSYTTVWPAMHDESIISFS